MSNFVYADGPIEAYAFRTVRLFYFEIQNGKSVTNLEMKSAIPRGYPDL